MWQVMNTAYCYNGKTEVTMSTAIIETTEKTIEMTPAVDLNTTRGLGAYIKDAVKEHYVDLYGRIKDVNVRVSFMRKEQCTDEYFQGRTLSITVSYTRHDLGAYVYQYLACPDPRRFS